MTPDEFIHIVIDRVIDANCKSSNQLLDSADSLDDVTDEYWKRVLTLYRSLDDDSQRVIKDIVREESVSAILSFFALLDGVEVAETAPKRFTLSYDNGSPLNGDLLDLLVEAAYG